MYVVPFLYITNDLKTWKSVCMHSLTLTNAKVCQINECVRLSK